uniref:Uncharacterized protein n=1 Tax=Anopheles melas TaxID=34690 RepID=A0A182UAU9_9DIPT
MVMSAAAAAAAAIAVVATDSTILYEIVSCIVFVMGKEQCRTPDSPEGARVVAPRSPISPQISQHHSTLVPPRSASSQVNRHGSSSPTGTVNGGGSGSSLGSLTPPPAITPASAAAVAAAAAAAAAQQDTAKLLKIRRFLGALVQFGQDANVDTGDRVRALVLSLAVSEGGKVVGKY